MKRTVAMMMLGATLSLSLPALAQPDVQKRAQVRQQATELVMQRLTQELALDPATQAQLRQSWDRTQSQIEGVRKEMWLAMKELRAQLQSPTPDNARLSQLSDVVVNDRAKVEQLEQQRIAEWRRILTPAQFAKAVLVSPRIKREVQQQVMQAVRGMRAPGGGEDVE